MSATPTLSAGTALLLGTLTVGGLDLLDAIVFFGLRGVAPIRILQSIASGLLGRAAYAGGVRTALLGLVLHLFIAFSIVATFMLAARLWPVLIRRPWICGPAYGVLVYLVMNLIVVPLSAAATGPLTPPVVANGLLIHLVGVGLPSALFARATGPSPG